MQKTTQNEKECLSLRLSTKLVTTFAPTTNGRVAAVYDTVQYVAKSCEEVEKTIFKDLKRKGNLGKDIVILDGRSVTIFLMPAGPGCVVIRKEVVR